jgi:PST family polysaccharide transporter
MQLLNTLVLPLLVIINFSAESIVVILLGNQWLESVLPFQILSIAALFRVNYKLLAELIRAISRPDFVMKVQVISMVLILLFTILGSYFGLVGVATGTVFAYLIQYILYEYFLYTYFLNWESFILLRNIKIGLLLSFVYVFIFLSFEYLLGLNNLYSSIISIVFFLILCFSLIYFKTKWIIPHEFISLIPSKFKYGKQ